MVAPYIMGIAGGSGSGKTYFAKELQKNLGDEKCTIIYQDNYYRDQSDHFDGDGGSVNFDHPDSIDFDMLAMSLAELKKGKCIEVPVYDFATHTRKRETLKYAPKKIILVEGILILDSLVVRRELDEAIFFDTPEEVRYQRRLERDVKERGRTAEGVYKQFNLQVKPMHNQFVEPSKVHAKTLVKDLFDYEKAIEHFTKAFFLLLFGLFILSTESFAATKHILVLGDSLSEGQGLDEEQAFPRIVEKNLREKKYDVAITNGGISGSTSASGLTRLKWHLKKKIDILVLELGANDGLRGLKLSETEKNLNEIIKLAQENKAKVLLLGLLMPPNYGKAYTKEFESMYEKISKKQKIPFLPFLLNGVAGRPELNLADGVHPNAKGQEIVAKLVTDFIEKNL